MVSNLLFDANERPSSGDVSSPQAAVAANVRTNLDACLEVLPTLNVGLDVNCKFAGVHEFEYTKELAVFDLLDISLFHGWVVSSQDEKAFAAFGQLSYNQIVEKLIAFEEAQQSIVDSSAKKAEEADSAEASSPSKSPSSSPEVLKVIGDGMLIKEFLDRTASQLSYDGLLALHEAVRERELAVFFRNSHFNAMMKYKGDLYLLCTDIAFSSSHLVWERLDEVDGNTSYVDADFTESSGVTEEQAAVEAAQVHSSDECRAAVASQSDADAMMAWQLMQEDLQAQQQAQQVALQQQALLQAQQAAIVDSTNGRTGQVPPAQGLQQPPAAKADAKKDAKKKKGKACTLQ